jgi:polysaccharide export outer membrane protein
MRPGTLLLAAFLAPALFCQAQDKATAPQPAAQQTSKLETHGASASTADDTYIIGPSDVLTVTVFQQSTLSGSVLVRPDGMISIPLLGDVQASGKTPLRLASEIAGKLKKFVQDPDVTVVLSQINSKVIYLIGEAAKPGPIAMSPGMTLLQAIATGGGLTEYANSKKIYILRGQGGQQKKIPVHYKQALRGDGSLNLALEPGDTIVVP